MPLYKTMRPDLTTIGIYSGSRQQVAACKALTALRRKNKDLTDATVLVQTDTRKMFVTYRVTYETVVDEYLGTLQRPVARKITPVDTGSCTSPSSSGS